MTRLLRARNLAALALAIAVAWLAPAPASAQALYGSVVGTVTDAQGAVTPGVTVTATNTGTGLKAEAVTDSDGSYALRNLMPGTYDLTANLSGFREHQQKAIPVAAGNAVRIDVKLEVGTVSERVEVVSETTLLQTEKGELNSQISSAAVTNLPLNQFRNYQKLLDLVPGATPTQYQNAEIDTPGRSLRTWVNGTQPNANTTRVDGAVSVNVWLPHHAMYVQSAESIDTVNVATNNFDADTGMAAGAAQTVITKSGTNEIKGSGFFFLNTDAMNTNTFFNQYNHLPKPGVNTKTFGGTLGGPIKKNKLFYFGSWERYHSTRPTTYTYVVPTAKMRAGDFSEVAAAYPSFKLFNPFSGVNGVGREQWTDNKIPSQYMNQIALAVMNKFLPPVNSATDLNKNLLLDDYSQLRTEYQRRDNVDLKINWQMRPNAVLWGKYGEMKNKGTGSQFQLGFENPSVGDTRVILTTFGTTWTLSSNTVIDANFGMSRQDQTVLPADFGTNYGLEFGIPGTNNPNDIRESGLPVFESSYTINSNSANWMPLWRKEINYSGTLALTRVFSAHEIRAGMDFVRLELNHRQAEWGSYGLKGGFSFGNNTTGSVGYTSPGWNSFAAYLMGLPNFYAEDTQLIPMTGRENQFAWYVRDRWNVSQKLTLSGGLRLDFYPLMHRDGRGIERLDYNTYQVILGGIGGQPKNAGINYKSMYVEPRVGAAYRINENNVFRAGYGQTKNPLPWSRPMRGSFPFDINNNASAPGTYDWVTTLNAGIPVVNVPDMSSGSVVLPRGVFIRSPNPNDVDRGTVHQWNVTYERRLPGRIATEISYVGTATNGGYADLNLNVGVPGGGGTAAKYYSVAGTTAINDWASRTKSRYKGLQVALNRPFRNGLLLKGAYTWSQAKDMSNNDEDGWTGLTWNYLPLFDKNFAIAGFDRTHVFQMGWVYELPFLKEAKGAAGTILGGWQINGTFGRFSGTPFSIGGSNNAMACTGCGSILINSSSTGTPNRIGTPGNIPPGGTTDYSSYTYYDKSQFSQPSGLDLAGFGNTQRNQFRRPPQTNMDLGLFKAFPIGRFRPEFRVEIANVFNTRNWGAPNTSFTSPLFLTYGPGSVDTTATLGYRRIQLGWRLQF